MQPTFFLQLLAMASLLVYPQIVQGQTKTDSWSPEMQMTVRVPGTPRVSPNGKKVVYTVASPIMSTDKSEYHTQIWIATTDGKENDQLTFGEKSATNPRWSPDGNGIAFTSTRINNRNNIFLLKLAKSEPVAITNLKGNVSNFEFSPDGASIAFLMTDVKSQEEEMNEKGKNDFRWIGEGIKMTRLYLLQLDSIEGKNGEPVLLPTGNGNVAGFDWSPDSRKIIINHTAQPGINYNSTSDISLLDLTSKVLTTIAAKKVPEILPKFSPDGSAISYLVGKSPDLGITNDYRMLFQPLQGGKPIEASFSFDGRTTLFPGWAADGRFYFIEAKGTLTSLYSIDPANGKVTEKKTNAVYSAISLNDNGTMFSFIQQTTQAPPEVYVVPYNGGTPTLVSTMNRDLPKGGLGRTEVIKWKSVDGKEIEGLLTYPVNYKLGQKVPLLLVLHGGPNGIYQQTFIGNPEEYPIASFASNGFAILRPNPRGSTGYGTPFRLSVVRDFGGNDYKDVMTGVDKVIVMGVADPERMGVMGWSYGGFMTSWIIGHTKRFKAASAGAAPINFISMVSTTDYSSMIKDYFVEDHWNDPVIFQKRSPISYVKNMVTPTLVQHGEADIRVPVSQGYELYYALKQRGIPTKMLVLPRQQHIAAEPKMKQIIMKSNLEWFLKYIFKKDQ